MAKIDVLDILRTKKQTPLEFDYDNLWIPPMHVYLTPQDIEALRNIATSIKLSSKIELKYKMIDNIMRNRGFKRFSAGTNRVVYSFLEDTRFVVKIAVDRVGMQDNPMEYKNQAFLKPYCTKMFYISPCGTVGFAERVLPIKNRNEFKEIASDVFDILVNRILGTYVMEDIGTKYFMNYGVRPNDGPVLLDYPFIYKLDGKKLYCNKVHPVTNQPCDGEIDYDAGFNHLVCSRCGKIYLASDLRDDSIDNKIIIKGGTEMKIQLKKGNEVISTPIPSDDVMIRPKKKRKYESNGLVVKISGGSIQEAQDERPGVDETKEPEIDENLHTDDLSISQDENDKGLEDVPQSVEPEDDSTPDPKVEFYTKSNFIDEDKDGLDKVLNDGPAEDSDYESIKETLTNPVEENVEVPVEDDSKDTKSDSKKESSAKKSTTSKSPVEKKSEPDKSTDDLDEKYANYDRDDNDSTYQPIRKKKSVERDTNGRFVSSGGKKKTTRIPSN